MSGIARPPLAFGHHGSTGFVSWRCLNAANTAALTAASTVTGTMFLALFRIYQPCTMSNIGLEISTPAVGNIHFCIYAPTSATNKTPAALLLDTGNISTNASPATFACSLALQPGEYWCGAEVSATVGLRIHSVNSLEALLGFTATLGTAARGGFTVARAYAAFPSPFSGSLVDKTTAGIPAICATFS